MNKIILTAAAALLCLPALFGKTEMKTGTDQAGRTYQYTVPDPFNVRIYQLKNGMTVYLASNPAEPTINVMTIVKAGSMDEPEHSTGLAHYFEHMMFKGTDRIGTLDWKKEKPLLDKLEQLFEKRRNSKDPAEQEKIYEEIDRISAEAAQYASPGEFSKLTDSLGASGLNAATSYNYTNYVAKIPSTELEKYLKLETERFRNPVLRLFHTELETVYEEFNRGQDNDYRRSMDVTLQNLFPGHPVGRSVIGLPEHIKLPSMKDTMAFYRTFYVPSNMAVILTGDLDFESTMDMLEQTLGTLPANPAPTHKTYPILPLNQSRTIFITGSDAEHVRVSFRIPLTPENKILSNVLVSLLCDNGYGIIDQNLTRSRKVLNAAVFSFELRDQIIFMFAGSPKHGQSTEQVARLFLRELKQLKQGTFERWRIRAVAENLRVRLAALKSSNNGDLNDELADLFLSGASYSELLNIPDAAEKITKKQISDFIQTHMNYHITVCKQSGKPRSVIKVDKPKITPVKLRSGVLSPFAKEFLRLPAKELNPEKLDKEKMLAGCKLSSGRKFVHIKKDFGNGLFHIRLASPRGKYHDRRIEVALGYLEFLGTDKFTASGLRQEFYKLGMKMTSDTNAYETGIEISGPHGRYAEAMALLDHFLRSMKPDQEALNGYIALLLKDRMDTRKNPFQNFLHTAYYGWYGPDNPFVNVLSEQKLRSLKAEELTGLLKEIFAETSTEIVYSGPGTSAAAAAEAEKLPVLHGKPVPKRPFYPTRTPEKPTIWFVEYDKVQLSIGLVTAGKEFDPDDMAFEELINEYFFHGLDSIVFQEIRESRALAYSASGSYFQQREKGYTERSYLIIETQPDKAMEAIRAAKNLLKQVPFQPEKFRAAKNAVLKKMAAERKIGFEIYDFFKAVKRAGLNGDFRQDLYEKVKKIDEAEFKKLAEEKLSAPVYDLIIVGKPGEKLLKELSEFGTVKQLKQKDIFGY